MGALDGVRVLDLSREGAGAFAAMLLAEQGAETLLVEPPSGAPGRGQPSFHVWNRSKQSLTLDPADHAQLRALAATADVVLCDLPTPEAARLGLDYATLGRDHPALIYCALPPFGSRGPLADQPFTDPALIDAHAGIMGGQYASGPWPTYSVARLTSAGTALVVAGAICAALYVRERTGQGQAIECSMLAGALTLRTSGMLHGAQVRRLSTSEGNSLGPIPVYRLFRAKDGLYLFIACGNTRFWQRLCLVLDHPEWISDERWQGAPWVVDPVWREELAGQVAAIIATEPRDHWLTLLTAEEIPNAPVSFREDFIEDAQVRHLGMRAEVADPELGPTLQLGVPVRLHAAPGAIRGPAPRLGEGGADVAARWSAAPSPWQPSIGRVEPLPAHALAGVRVLDLSGYIAGAFCPMVLADYGADVIKVESLDGDAFRTNGYGFLGWNRGKRGLSVDLRTEAGRQVVYELVRSADVLNENFRPGVAKKLGVDYETLAALNPRLIYSTATAFGSDGPLAHLPGFDPLIQARSGAMAAQGGVGQGHPPVFNTVALSDYGAALLSVFGIGAALVQRERNGLGQRVETSLVQAALTMQAGEFIFYPGKPDPVPGGPALAGVHALYRLYQAADRWLFLGCRTAEQVDAIARVTGVALPAGAAALREPLHGPTAEALAAAFMTRTAEAWVADLLAEGVPAGRVFTPPELFDDPQVQANDLLTTHQHPVWGEVQQTGVLVKFAKTPGIAQRVAPLLGQHSVEVLAEAGFAAERIQNLLASGVVYQSGQTS